MKALLVPEFGLYNNAGVAMYDSLQVADLFGKEHKNVLRDAKHIRSMIFKDQSKPEPISEEEKAVLDSIAEFIKESKHLNFHFKRGNYKDSYGRKQPKMYFSKDDFMLLTMGYTGAFAMSIKILYMDKFNAMEDFLRKRDSARMEYPALTQAIKEAHEEPKHYHYSNEADLINIVVIGKRAREIREEYGLEKGCSIRDYLSAGEIAAIEELQRIDTGLVAAGMDYQQRKETLSAHFNNKILQRLAA